MNSKKAKQKPVVDSCVIGGWKERTYVVDDFRFWDTSDLPEQCGNELFGDAGVQVSDVPGIVDVSGG